MGINAQINFCYFFIFLVYETYSHLRAMVQPEIFHGKEGFGKLGHFSKHFVKTSRKKTPQWRVSEFYLLDTTKSPFWMVSLTEGRTQSGTFFPKLVHFCLTFKKVQVRSPLLSHRCASDVQSSFPCYSLPDMKVVWIFFFFYEWLFILSQWLKT